jgi:hypothetical protein
MSRKWDRRLLGLWRSDRARTLRYFKPRASCSPETFRKFKAIFGKLEIHWRRGRCHTSLDGQSATLVYEVVASDALSVVVRYYDDLGGENRLQQINFDGDRYFITLGGGFCEFFRKIRTRP